MSQEARCALVDLKHGLAVFFGSRPEMEERQRSLIERSRPLGAEEEATRVFLVVEESETGQSEFAYMREKRRLPRRLEMRLKARTSQ